MTFKRMGRTLRGFFESVVEFGSGFAHRVKAALRKPGTTRHLDECS
jgi:hypothetical protein